MLLIVKNPVVNIQFQNCRLSHKKASNYNIVNNKFVVFTMSERCLTIEDSIKEFLNESAEI